jgi:hypothetical protein
MKNKLTAFLCECDGIDLATVPEHVRNVIYAPAEPATYQVNEPLPMSGWVYLDLWTNKVEGHAHLPEFVVKKKTGETMLDSKVMTKHKPFGEIQVLLSRKQYSEAIALVTPSDVWILRTGS